MNGVFDKLKNLLSGGDDEEIEVYEDEPRKAVNDDYEMPPTRTPRHRTESSSPNKVVNIHATAQLKVVLSKPEIFATETSPVADELIAMHTVLLNLEKTEDSEARRIIDFLSGVAYANGGKIKRVATNTYIIIPYNVNLSGDDVMDGLENSGISF